MKISGIYKIENIINGKVYIGQSKDLFKRYDQHFCNAVKHSDKSYLYYSMNNHGIENFTFQILKITFDLDYWEKFFIYWYKSNDSKFGYNLTNGGQKNSEKKNIFSYSDEIKLKMSKKAKERWSDPIYRRDILESQRIGRCTNEGRKNRSEATKKMWESGKFSEQAKKISEKVKGRKKSQETKLKMKKSAKLRELKHQEDYAIYISRGVDLNYVDFHKHYKKGKNDLLGE